MVIVEWKEVERFIEKLHIFVKSKKLQFTGVYGIPRGGTVLAVLISHALNIPFLGAPCEGCIIVDDISDSGITLKHYREKGYFISTMHYKQTSRVCPDFYGTTTNDWIVYPWEKKYD